MGNVCRTCLGGRSEEDETPLQNTPPPESNDSSPHSRSSSLASEPPPPYSSALPASQRRGEILNVGDLKKREADQIARAKRVSLLHQIPTGSYTDGSKADKECPICMVEFEEGEKIRSLPCHHTFHLDCIDDWLLRSEQCSSFACPSCMEPVDAALLSAYQSSLSDFLTDVKLGSLSTSPAAAGPSSIPKP